MKRTANGICRLPTERLGFAELCVERVVGKVARQNGDKPVQFPILRLCPSGSNAQRLRRMTGPTRAFRSTEVLSTQVYCVADISLVQFSTNVRGARGVLLVSMP